ncbi:MAG: N-6 DNA methylase [Bacteroidales bacterium]|nr:N-6 DNA methylase [Bacteroidales bacterium]
MNTETLRQIFQSPFNYPKFSREIVHDLFGCNDVYETLDSAERLDPSPDGDQNYFLGQMEDAERRLLGFFYTRVAEGSDVRRKRVGLRKLIQPYLKYEVDAAIAVFDDGHHWRLSYICDHKEGTTSAKRFSYVLGDKAGQYKTPLERLDKVAAKAGRFKMDDLRDAFSVDALSKEFFDEYHRHYDRILRTTVELISKDPTLYSGLSKLFADYIKKMMGRIVFLHFLQKKGWLNGDPEFLKNLFSKQPLDRKEDFLEQVLEPLFFGIFNTEPQNREKLFRDEGWDVQLLEQWKGLPYLNGGLFERDMIDNAKMKLPASLFEQLFDFMSSYNFTVDENDPDDADIGVDPEMLGKIFESLLEDNKAKGAFYTPKEIVRYMCKESLIAYLNSKVNSESTGNQITNHDSLVTAVRQFVEQHEFPEVLEPYREVLDTALREVKICDPAIGSGAFPMGLLNELWRCREALIGAADTSERCDFNNPAQATGVATEGSNTCAQCGDSTAYNMRAGGTRPQSRAALKKQIIENNIYGVDIEKGAIDIARLRFWLSIVVDAEKPEPLPNFDYKFMQGNSLIESFDGHDLSHIMDASSPLERGAAKRRGMSKAGWGENQTGMEFGSEEVKQNLRNWLKMYFSLTDHKEKAYYRELINSSVKNYIVQQGIGSAAETRLNIIDPSANKDFFLWHTWFKDIFDKGGFDIVIGNPPYFQMKKGLVDKSKYQYSEGKDKGKQNIYKLFVEHAYNILNNGGICALITQSSLMCDSSSQYTRELLIKKTSLFQVIEFPKVAPHPEGQLFKGALVATCIVLFSKNLPCNNNTFFLSANNDLTTINNFDFAVIPQQTPIYFYPQGYYFPLIRHDDFSIIGKMNEGTTFLGNMIQSSSQGDFNLTNESFCFSTRLTDVKMYRGCHVHRFYIEDEVEEYIQKNHKASYISRNEHGVFLVCQNISGMTDKQRFNVAISKNNRCLFGHTVNKIELKSMYNPKYIRFFRQMRR